MTEHDVESYIADGELAAQQRGRIAPGSLLDVRDQARLYLEAMGLDATKRQQVLRRRELTEQKRARRDGPA